MTQHEPVLPYTVIPKRVCFWFQCGFSKLILLRGTRLPSNCFSIAVGNASHCEGRDLQAFTLITM